MNSAHISYFAQLAYVCLTVTRKMELLSVCFNDADNKVNEKQAETYSH